MRQVATIPDERVARRLADYLLTLGITTRLDVAPDGCALWVHREEKVPTARREMKAFLENPNDPKYSGVEKIAEAKRREAALAEKTHVRNTIRLEGQPNVPSWRRCPVTYALIAISIVVGVWTGLGQNRRAIQPFLLSPSSATLVMAPAPVIFDEDERGEILQDQRPVLVPTLKAEPSGLEPIKHGQIWRLISPIFLHFDILHIAFNMMWLYQLGSLIEMRKGNFVLAAVVLSSAVISNLSEYFWELHQRGPEAILTFGGMSGVVYALFGYCWMKSDYDHDADIRMPSNTVGWMIGWLVLCMTGLLGPIANAAHLVGLVVGMVFVLVPHFLREWR